MIIKNSNIRRNLFENRYVIFAVIVAIILVLSLIQFFNKNAKESATIKANEAQNIVNIANRNNNNSSGTITTPDANQNIQDSKKDSKVALIEEFISYCNKKEIGKAYELLTDQCKEEVFFSNIQNFKNNYVDKIFTTQKMYSVQNWMNSETYKIRILDNIISTGNTSLQNAVEDYYTVVKQQSQYKLNINGYIGKKQMDRTAQQNGVKVTILCKNVYKEYEIYEVKVENTSDQTILLDSKEKTSSIYLMGSNEQHYDAYTYEVDQTNLQVEPNRTKILTIRFHKLYSNRATIEAMVFEDIIMDVKTYETQQDKKLYTNRMKMKIEIEG